MPEDFDGNEIETDDEHPVFPSRRANTGKADDLPVANADDLPLFPDANKKQSRTVSYVAVIREDGANRGYKGNLKPGSTEQTIFQIFGNGIYTLEARTEKHKPLRTRENVQVNFEEDSEKSDGKPGTAIQGYGPNDLKSMLTEVLNTRESESKRLEDLAKSTADQSRNQSEKFVDMVKETTTASKEADREFFANTSKQSQEFMSNILAANQNNFQNMMTLLQQGHNQTMQQLNAINDRERNSDNPMMMVSLLVEGLKMGREFEGDDTPDWIKAMSEGGKMLGDIKEMAALKASMTPSIPALKALVAQNKLKKQKEGNRVVKENPDTEATEGKPVPVPKELAQTEVDKLANLKEILRKRGIDPEEFLDENINHYANASDKDIFGEEETEDSPDKSNSDDTNESTEQGEE
jgi:hypothetical protein